MLTKLTFETALEKLQQNVAFVNVSYARIFPAVFFPLSIRITTTTTKKHKSFNWKMFSLSHPRS